MFEYMYKILKIFPIVYFICLFLEILSLKKNKIDIFYKENFAIAIFNSAFFPLSLLVFSFGVDVFKNIWNNNKEGFIILYFCSFIFISLSYIVGYIKRTIYAFISPENKLSSLEFKKTYEKININKM